MLNLISQTLLNMRVTVIRYLSNNEYDAKRRKEFGYK